MKTASKPKFIFEGPSGRIDATSTIPRMARRIKELLDAHPDGKLMSTSLVAEKLGIITHSMREVAAHPVLAPYRMKCAQTIWWANPKTIKEANEQARD